MKRAFILVATLLAVLAPIIALRWLPAGGYGGGSLRNLSGVAAQSNLAIAATLLANQGDGSLLPPVRNAGANWSSAGLLSVRGIPARSTVCATVSPLGSGQDDTTNIRNAVDACPLGLVVSLAAGTWSVNMSWSTRG
jgi:hypothetical protein